MGTMSNAAILTVGAFYVGAGFTTYAGVAVGNPAQFGWDGRGTI
jgi:hypothetical protein